jgi:uncharacterized protein YndB with AHSA1/START domain
METITHSITIQVPPAEVFEAFSSLGGIRSWWTNAISGNPDKGGELKMEIGMNRHILFSVSGLKKNSFMALTALSSNFPEGQELVGTETTLKVATNASRTTNLVFTQSGWKEKTPLYKTTTKQWLTRLESLKKLCESGKGDPEIVTLPRK